MSSSISFIPPYGIVGAAVATLIAEIVLMTGALAVLRAEALLGLA